MVAMGVFGLRRLKIRRVVRIRGWYGLAFVEAGADKEASAVRGLIAGPGRSVTRATQFQKSHGGRAENHPGPRKVTPATSDPEGDNRTSEAGEVG